MCPWGQGDNLEGPTSFIRVSSDKPGRGEQRLVHGKGNEPYYNHSMCRTLLNVGRAVLGKAAIPQAFKLNRSFLILQPEAAGWVGGNPPESSKPQVWLPFKPELKAL